MVSRNRSFAACVSLALLALAAVAAASASAATLTTDRRCYRTNEALSLSGGGYTPNGSVPFTLNTQPWGALTADPNGAVSYTVKSPPPAKDPTKMRDYTLTATDQTNPALTATTKFQVVHTNVTIKPALVTPGMVTFSAVGFTSGDKLYIHYLLNGKHVVTKKLGKLHLPCATLKKQARMFLFRPVKPGNYTLVFDTSKSYSAKFRPSFSVQAYVRTTFY